MAPVLYTYILAAVKESPFFLFKANSPLTFSGVNLGVELSPSWYFTSSSQSDSPPSPSKNSPNLTTLSL